MTRMMEPCAFLIKSFQVVFKSGYSSNDRTSKNRIWMLQHLAPLDVVGFPAV